jgi:hypothetical protein
MAAYGVTTPEDEKKALKKGYGVPQPVLTTQTETVLRQSSEDANTAAARGNYGQAMGEAARGLAGAIPAMALDLAAPFVPAARGVGNFASTVATGMPMQEQPPAPAVVSAPKLGARDPAVAPPVVPPVNFNPRVDSNAAGGGATVPVPNGYTGPAGENMSMPGEPGKPDAQYRRVVDANGGTLFTNQSIESDARLMARGVPSAQNMAAADALSNRSRVESLVSTYGVDGARGVMGLEPRQPDTSPRALALEQIKSIRDRNQPLTARGIQTLTDLNSADNTARDSAQRNANEARRVASGEAEAAQRIGVGRDLQATTKELAALQAKFAASTDPKERERLREEILLRQGKDKNEPNRFTVVPGGSAVDPATGQVVREPSRVLDNQTGRFVEQGAAAAAPKYETGKVYQDAQGRKAKWDGSKFVPA